jgi:GTP-binding protein EngB required for normal cell division
VNALVGVLPRFGPAKVSDRAGWTDQLCFYQLGKRPPVLTMVDLPGYGHAVATAQDKIAWNRMMKDYLSTRKVLSRYAFLPLFAKE